VSSYPETSPGLIILKTYAYNKTLGLIKRVCARDVVDANTRKLLYCAVVRPNLEYASCMWSPYSAKQRKLIENVQRRATKFIVNYPPRDVTYTETD
jgi:hypothetical protein